eukprot:3941653-Rhodomonas_salina.3
MKKLLPASGAALGELLRPSRHKQPSSAENNGHYNGRRPSRGGIIGDPDEAVTGLDQAITVPSGHVLG